MTRRRQPPIPPGTGVFFPSPIDDELERQRRERVLDRQLRKMSIKEALQWAADPNGRLTDRSRLEQIARARHYRFADAWVSRVHRRSASRVVKQMLDFHDAKMREIEMKT